MIDTQRELDEAIADLTAATRRVDEAMMDPRGLREHQPIPTMTPEHIQALERLAEAQQRYDDLIVQHRAR